ncbi:O-methyltransferase, putative [Talaromyces stipitatus ATCC 10500]|uniref:catechol O-methyltransferase n=1 Tax=Talaromyces stipitatus (strain ATCC 10500 / CBS 375.48 / QM 6759 / NRRL 1006) TaxID=441959 RepID=B8MJG0_TALSN|nr:O-methyltransferase, putative [Talaromyces stipitatus ATCC 10500]EED15160.1 O-methyltransferase, putative [Talaromyces stipitatus ATCC 10500]
MPQPTIENIGSYDDLRELHLLHYIYSLPNLSSLRNNPAAIIREIDTFSEKTGKILMTVGPEKGAFLTNIIAARKPSTVIELGGFVGYSAILLGDALRANGGKRYLSLEINPVNAAVANLLIELAGLRDVVTIHVAPSHKTLAEFVNDNVIDYIEVMLVDHWKDRYLPDLWLMENLGLFKAGVTVLAADNCLMPGAPDFLEWVRASKEKKGALLKTKYGFSEDGRYVKGEELVKAIKDGKEDVELENVPGDPNWVYETEMTEFDSNGRHDGIEVVKVVGKQ